MEIPSMIEELIALSTAEAATADAEAVEPLHLFIAVCKQNTAPVAAILHAHTLHPEHLCQRLRVCAHEVGRKHASGQQQMSERTLLMLEQAWRWAASVGRTMDSADVLMALLEQPDADLRYILQRENLPVAGLIEDLKHQMLHESASDKPQVGKAVPLLHQNHPSTPVLDHYGKDYTALAREGKLDPVIGRNDEIKQVVRVLLRKQKNNPVLIGEAGVGKTSVVARLALRVVAENAPEQIRELRIVEVMLSALGIGTQSQGAFAEWWPKLITEAESDPQLVVCFDAIHTLIGTGSVPDTLDAANILKLALARGSIRCIGVTTSDAYRQYLEKEPALEQWFQPVHLTEPTPEQVREILRGLRHTYETHHGMIISDEAIDTAVELAAKYLPDRRFPEKGCALIDQAAAAKRFITFTPNRAGTVDEGEVTREDVARVVGEWTGMPMERLTKEGLAPSAHRSSPVQPPGTLAAGTVLHSALRPATEEEVALLLLDIVKSTEIVLKFGDTLFTGHVDHLYNALRLHPSIAEMRFLKCTGDGFLVVYRNVSTAIEVARGLRSSLRGERISLRFVVHRGHVKIGPNGDPLGAEVHRLFRMEALQEADCVEMTPRSGSLPEHSHIVITRAALDHLPMNVNVDFERIGMFRLKGFDHPEEVWAEKVARSDSLGHMSRTVLAYDPAELREGNKPCG